MSLEANYEFEAFVKLDSAVANANILSIGGLALAVTASSTLQLTSTDCGIDSTTSTELTPNVWHHLLLRFPADTLRSLLTAHRLSVKLLPARILSSLKLLLLAGMSAGWTNSSVPEVPTTAHEAEIVPVEVPATTTSNTPV